MKAIYKNVIYFFLMLLILNSCNKPTPRFPITNNSRNYFKEFIDQNKLLVEYQDKAFKDYITEHPERQYINSQNGFWYAYVKQNAESNQTPKTGDTVSFTYQIADIDHQIIYKIEELGEQSYVIDKEQRETGLRKGLKLMKENEVVEFLFPSFLAYGVLGDRKKIKTNQPLIYTVYLKKIINNKNNQK